MARPRQSPKRLFLFDLDGVILNSRANMEAAWAEVCARTPVDIPFEEYFALIGRPFGDILALLGIRDRTDEVERIFRMASINRLELMRFYPGIEDVLQALEAGGISLGVVTSKDQLRTGAILAKLPVHFATVQTPNDRYRGKPAPDHLLAAMAEAHVDPAETIYIGDMDADFEAAVRAGVEYAHASWGYGPAPADATVVLAETTKIMDLRETVQE